MGVPALRRVRSASAARLHPARLRGVDRPPAQADAVRAARDVNDTLKTDTTAAAVALAALMVAPAAHAATISNPPASSTSMASTPPASPEASTAPPSTACVTDFANRDVSENSRPSIMQSSAVAPSRPLGRPPGLRAVLGHRNSAGPPRRRSRTSDRAGAAGARYTCARSARSCVRLKPSGSTPLRRSSVEMYAHASSQ